MARPAYDVTERVRIEGDIRSAALRLFGKLGYREVSMRAIAGELGWSAAALYRYYPSKEALLDAIRADGFRELRTILAGIRTRAAAPSEMISTGLVAYLQFSREQPDLYRLMYELDQGEVASDETVPVHRKAAFAEAMAIAADVLRVTGFDGDANLIAHQFWIGAHGLAALALANQLDMGQDYEALVEPVVRMILRGGGAALGEWGEK